MEKLRQERSTERDGERLRKESYGETVRRAAMERLRRQRDGEGCFKMELQTASIEI